MYVGGYKKVVKMHRGENPIVTLWYKKQVLAAEPTHL
jgi:hypothetical protein